jgi:hypothetical protein
MPDSGFVITGHVDDTVPRPWLYLVRTDPQGETLWSRVYDPKLELLIGLSICVTRDSGYVITGIGNDPDTTVHRNATFLLKTNWKGDTLWLRRYHGDTVGNLEAYCVRQTADGGFVLAGYEGSRWRVWLLCTDSLGDSLWARVFGDLAPGCAHDVQQTRDGGFAVSALVNNYYACLIKTDTLGLVSSVAESPASQSVRPAFSVWPNPFSDRVSFELSVSRMSGGKLQILDASGRLVRTLSAEARTIWDATDDNGLLAPKGVYFARLLPDTSATVQKLLLIR